MKSRQKLLRESLSSGVLVNSEVKCVVNGKCHTSKNELISNCVHPFVNRVRSEPQFFFCLLKYCCSLALILRIVLFIFSVLFAVKHYVSTLEYYTTDFSHLHGAINSESISP